MPEPILLGDLFVAISDFATPSYVTPIQHYRAGALVQELALPNASTFSSVGHLDVDGRHHLFAHDSDHDAVEEFGQDANPLRTYYSFEDAVTGKDISGIVSDSGSYVYFGHTDLTNTLLSVYKYRLSDASFVGLVMSFPGAFSLRDLDLASDGCTLLVLTELGDAFERADGCTESAGTDFLSGLGLGVDVTGAHWTPDGGVILTTQLSGVRKYSAAAALEWTHTDDGRGWGGVDVDPDGVSAWVTTVPQYAATVPGQVNRIIQLSLADGSQLDEFTPANTVDGISGEPFLTGAIALVPALLRGGGLIFGTIVG